MGSGFNTDVEVGERLFHVQTEDRGPQSPVIDTAVYQNGRVLYRRSSNYEHFAKSSEFSVEDLRERVEEQHRCVIEDIRSGELDAEIAAAGEKAARAGGIEVQLLNTKSWLRAGNISLDLEILRRADRQPEAGAEVEASIEGAAQGAPHTGTSDKQGRARIEFPLPAPGKGELTLVIKARAASGKDEIRFAMRPKSKAPPVGAAS
jgi:hypothetical protein